MNESKHLYNFGIVGNCSFMSYIDLNANVVWQCWPRFDSSFIFGGLLGQAKGGEFSISPQKKFSSRQYYLSNTNILVTHFECEDGEYRVIDFAPRFRNFDRNHRPLAFYRKVELIKGAPLIKAVCNPVGKYGKVKGEKNVGSNSINFHGLEKAVRLTTNASLTHIEDEAKFSLTETKYFALTWGNPLEAPLEQTAEDFLRRTKEYWEGWIRTSSIPGIFQEEVIRSALLLKLHQFEDTGAIIASGTTSLPEYPGSGRNWDYRYCWIRDSYFTLTALIGLGHFTEAEKYAHWLQNVIKNNPDSIQPVYKISGDPLIPESEIELEGHCGNKPVRIGNDAYKQKQHDVYGQMILSLEPLYTDLRVCNSNSAPDVNLIHNLLSQIQEVMDSPDSGIWEFRGISQKHTESFLFHWAGGKAAKKIGKKIGDIKLVQIANEVIEASVSQIEKCFDETKRAYGMSQENKELNASEFLLVSMKYLTDIDKSKSHVRALEKELRTNGDLIYRYLTKDDFGDTESTFLICAFWYAEALIDINEEDRAKEVFESLIQKANHLGIFSEDICPKNFSQWGNVAQTYSHVGLINTAIKLSRKFNLPGFLVEP